MQAQTACSSRRCPDSQHHRADKTRAAKSVQQQRGILPASLLQVREAKPHLHTNHPNWYVPIKPRLPFAHAEAFQPQCMPRPTCLPTCKTTHNTNMQTPAHGARTDCAHNRGGPKEEGQLLSTHRGTCRVPCVLVIHELAGHVPGSERYQAMQQPYSPAMLHASLQCHAQPLRLLASKSITIDPASPQVLCLRHQPLESWQHPQPACPMPTAVGATGRGSRTDTTASCAASCCSSRGNPPAIAGANTKTCQQAQSDNHTWLPDRQCRLANISQLSSQALPSSAQPAPTQSLLLSDAGLPCCCCPATAQALLASWPSAERPHAAV